MIKRLITRRKHKKALWLFRRCYESLDWIRNVNPDLTRENMLGRHNSYKEIVRLLWGDGHDKYTGILNDKSLSS